MIRPSVSGKRMDLPGPSAAQSSRASIGSSTTTTALRMAPASCLLYTSTSASALTALTRWHGSSCGSKATTPRPTTAPSATPLSTLPRRISSAFSFTQSSAPSRSPAPSPSTTSRSPRMRTAIRVSAAMATAITCSSPTTPRCPGRPAPSSPT